MIFLQVINQYAISQDEGARHSNRYDVTILVNGFPMIHVELKRRGVAIREAFNQIDRYQRDSFWAGSGLFEYVQIFVISNGTNTKYYSNSTRFNAIKDAKSGKQKKEKTSNSFEFTCFWADANNRVIPDLIDFTRTFFARHTILNILTKYCIFTSENMLMVMRPYQITATERILNRIEIANNYKKYGTVAGGGYIWHTTGSGKTLTSFKTARQASQLPYIDKVLFVVDRKDLDYVDMEDKPHPGYVDMIDELTTKFPLSEPQIVGEQNQKDFIALFGAILRMRNLLSSFDEFKGQELISERDLQDYLGRYQDLRDEWRRRREDKDAEDITDDLVFEVELIRQIEINIDYILLLVKKYHDTHCTDKEVLITIQKAIDASPELRSKKVCKELYLNFLKISYSDENHTRIF